MKFIILNEKDNVAVALTDLKKNDSINTGNKEIIIRHDIETGHKIAIEDIPAGSDIIKYGHPVGHAAIQVHAGDHVHSHNLKTNLSGILEYSYVKKTGKNDDPVSPPKINAFRRSNGDVGIRNELWIIPTVGCVNGTCDLIRAGFLEQNKAERIDGVFVFPHNYGCSQLGDDHVNTRTILQDMAMHPNAGAVLVVGLGCENNQTDEFFKTMEEFDTDRIKAIVAQDYEDEIAAGIEILNQLYDEMKKDVRSECSLSSLKIGLECGGSDALSGITANPLLGVFSNYMTNCGGTTVLTEVPEMFGAETFLMERAADEEVYDKIVSMINDYKDFFIKHDQEIYENPSPGNKKGGITTLEEKSLGAVEKSGKSEIKDVLKYGERITSPGLQLLSAPGNDLVATTALAASGCQMIIFTTGRGTPFGGPVPTIKVSTNTGLFKKKQNWIDFNAGALLENKTMETLLKELTEYVIMVADGKETKNEKNGFRNLTIFKSGVTL
ncbi:MAG: altronate dehydratase [Spirochaetes bacterium]|nr:altronate dehydratase [Spirochaetota bacterium]